MQKHVSSDEHEYERKMKLCRGGKRPNVPSGEAHMAGETFERLDIGIYNRISPRTRVPRPVDPSSHVLSAMKDVEQLTSQDVPLQMFVSGKGLATVCAKDHYG
jgi:hypothetical protein